ncbi:MAG: nicotinate phosphoribosyltransferase [Candidatus Levybacteria bacterium]|nr:nicotinate phosphoribosyltransferase [Candidatus Levybacteria bacterium]
MSFGFNMCKDFNIKNLILNVDSYKTSQHNQLPPNTRSMYGYIEARGPKDALVMFFGLQMFIKEYLSTPITMKDVNEADEFLTVYGAKFNRDAWVYIVESYGGYLPIKICSLMEGEVVPTGTVLVTIESIDSILSDDFNKFLVSYIETALLRAIWYPSTIASNDFKAKKTILHYLNESSDDPLASLRYKLHDFGARGVSSFESAGIGGCAHLVNFSGTDTITGVLYAHKYYNGIPVDKFVPAMEHSTVTAWGRDDETAAYSNMLDQYAKPGAIVSCVSDSYDLWNAVKNIWGDTLRERVKQSGALVVVRPDSQDPIQTPRKVIEILEEKIGYSVNKKGFRVLDPCIRVIQGDGIENKNIPEIYSNLLDYGHSADNLTLGMGGGKLQKVSRDDYSFAQKNSAIKIGNKWSDTYKDPIGAPEKKSKRGKFMVLKDKSGWKTMPLDVNDTRNELKTVFHVGFSRYDHKMVDIRARAESYLT